MFVILGAGVIGLLLNWRGRRTVIFGE